MKDNHIPADRLYSPDHIWIRQDGDIWTCGITDYAQRELGDIMYVDLPMPGTQFTAGAEFGSIESVKAVSPLYMPVNGELIATNGALADNPELVNSSCYDQGWIIKVRPSGPVSLLDKDAYARKLA